MKKTVTALELKRYLSNYPDATPKEIVSLKEWVKQGKSPYENGCHLSRENGCPMDFIEAERFERDRYQMFLEGHFVEFDPALLDELPF